MGLRFKRIDGSHWQVKYQAQQWSATTAQCYIQVGEGGGQGRIWLGHTQFCAEVMKPFLVVVIRSCLEGGKNNARMDEYH